MRILFLCVLLLSLLAITALASDGPGLTLDFGGARPPDGVTLSTNNTWTQDSALTLHAQESSAQVGFEIPEGEDCSRWVMEVTDRVVNLEPGQEWSVFPSFTLNGRNVPTEAIPWFEFRTTSYPVGPLLRPGKNVLILSSNVAEAWEYQIDRIRIGLPQD